MTLALRLTIRLSDAPAQRQTKMLYPDHRPPPWLTEDAIPRSLEPIVRCPRGAPNETGSHVLAARIDPKSTVSKACRDITTTLPKNPAQPTRAEAKRGVRKAWTCARTKALKETTRIEEALLEIDIGADIRYCGLSTALDQGHLTIRLSRHCRANRPTIIRVSKPTKVFKTGVSKATNVV
jgi:hypothetical protein